MKKENPETQMITVTFNIPNISCHHCVHTIESEIRELDGVKEVHADVAGQLATVSFEPPATEEKIKALLVEINYPASSLASPA